jgi:hypothetical protein
MYSTTALLGLNFAFAKLVTLILTTALCYKCHNYKLLVWHGVYSQKLILPFSHY